MKRKINILIIEDSKSYAQGMEMLLKQHELIKEICFADDYKSVFDVLKEQKIHIAILDLDLKMKDGNGMTIAKKMKQLYPKIKIIILTGYARVYLYKKLFNEYKVDAYVDKDSDVSQTFNAINAVLNNNKYVDHSIATMVEIGVWMRISDREKEVLDLMVLGKTKKEIGEKLFINHKTVNSHITNLFERFNIHKATELVAKYVNYKNANRENLDDMPSFEIGK